MSSEWLGAAVPAGLGMYIPGHPARRAAGVHLGPDAVILRAGAAAARFAWGDYDGPGDADRRRPPGAWWVTHMTAGRSGPRGVAIEEHVGAGRNTDAVRAAVRSLQYRLVRVFDGRVVVPLDWSPLTLDDGEAARTTFAVLLAALARRPTLRSRLADPQRVALLARDLGRRPLAAVPEPTGVRRATVETLGAMRALRYRHPLLGRPVPGDPLPPVGEAVDRVIARVRANPYARGVRLDPQRVAALARRHYLDVEPWPFGALTAPAVPAARPEPRAVPEPRPSARPAPDQAERPGPRPVGDSYGKGHRPSWWRSKPPWAPGDERD